MRVNDDRSMRERIYYKIRHDITYGQIMPGERLVESKLAEEFKTSRSPVREALRQLESDGLTRFERNKGITVTKLSIKEVSELYDLRLLLESYAARLSAENASEKHGAYLRDLHQKLIIAARNSDLVGWLRANNSFHDFFSEHCGNQNLHQILTSLKRRVYQYHFILIRIPGNFQVYLEQHDQILRSLEEKNGRMAEEYMRLHIQTFKEVLVNHLTSLESLRTAQPESRYWEPERKGNPEFFKAVP